MAELPDYIDPADPFGPSANEPISIGELREVLGLVPRLVDTEPTEAHDKAVQAALYSRAVGSTTWTDRVVNGSVERLASDLPPDVAAAKLWLQARRPQAWAEKREHTHHVIVERIAGQGVPAVGMLIEHDADELGVIEQQHENGDGQ